MPAGARVLPYRSNIRKISEFVFEPVDSTYHARAVEVRDDGGHAVVAGRNYGQGSSREHAALAPRYLGLRVVIALDFARIHWQNLVNFGVVPLRFAEPADYDRIERGDVLRLEGLRDGLGKSSRVHAANLTRESELELTHELSPRQVELLLAGGLMNTVREQITG
jgi:aconitate hydratase